jgi:predicted RNA binding protein YcfA (HicA-like mRNA interferase family)
MPRRLRELRRDLRKAGWSVVRQRGSHETWEHLQVSFPVVLSGKDSQDAQPYQERDVREAVEASRQV